MRESVTDLFVTKKPTITLNHEAAFVMITTMRICLSTINKM